MSVVAGFLFVILLLKWHLKVKKGNYFIKCYFWIIPLLIISVVVCIEMLMVNYCDSLSSLIRPNNTRIFCNELKGVTN